MAEATTPAKTTTARTRSTTARTRSKAPAKTAPAAKTAEVTPNEIRIVMEHVEDTKRFSKFRFPTELDGVVVGNVYAPLGTTTIKVLVQGVEPGSGAVESDK